MKIAIFGASGFAREVADICWELGYRDLCYIDRQPESDRYFGLPIFSEDAIAALGDDDYQFALGIGENQLRAKLADKFADLEYPNLIHPSASFGRGQRDILTTRRGNILTAGVRMTNNIELGDFGIFNLNCTVGHDCVIEDFVNVAPGATVSGNVRLSRGCYIGTGAAIIQGSSIEQKMEIGESAVVGAGAVVTKSVAAGATVKGVPAR